MKTDILMIFNWWKNSKGGGVKKYNEDLYDFLRSKNLKIGISYRNGFDNKSIKLPTNKFQFFLKLLADIKLKNPKTIIIDGFIPSLVSAIIYKYLVNHSVKIFFVFHTYPQDKHNNPLVNFFLKALLSQTKKVVFVSEGLKNALYSNYKLENIRYKIIKGGISLPKLFFNKKLHARQKIKIVSIGLFSNKTKALGAKLLIDSLPGVIRLFPRIKILLVGDGKYRGEILSYVKNKNLEEIVFCPGHIDNIEKVHKSAQIMIHPSYGDGLPISIIEAFAHGTPVIASKIGGIPELVSHGKNGLLFTNNIKDLIRNLFRLITDISLYERIRHTARQDVEQYYNNSRMGNEFYNLHEQ